MNLVQAGEIWTLTVTPHCEGVEGKPTTSQIRILDTDTENGVVIRWALDLVGQACGAE